MIWFIRCIDIEVDLKILMETNINSYVCIRDCLILCENYAQCLDEGRRKSQYFLAPDDNSTKVN